MENFLISLKKSFIVASVLGLGVASGSASACFGNLKFYAGVGLDYNTYSLSNLGKFTLNGVNFTSFKNYNTHNTKGFGAVVPVLGLKFHQHFGLEVGYSFNRKFDFEHSFTSGGVGYGATLRNKVKNAYLDLMGFMPVVDNIELVGGVGIGRLRVKTDYTTLSGFANYGSSFYTKNKNNCRFKIGAQYNFNNKVGVRALATYQRVNNKGTITASVPGAASVNVQDKFVKDIKSIGLAATYTF